MNNRLSLLLPMLVLALVSFNALSIIETDKSFNKGSAVTTAALKAAKSSDLVLLGQIWGFLKYHHPKIAAGQYHWDFELFRFLPKYLAATNKAQRDGVLLKWIEGLGAVSKCDKCKPTASDAFLKPNLNWVGQSDLAEKLKQKLRYIYANRSQGEHFYIGFTPSVGNVQFKHENPYADMPYPDAGFRLLALFRYWNMIHYYFPYKHLIKNSWHDRLANYLPAFINANNELNYELAMLQLIAEVKDTHANLWGGNNAIQTKRGQYYPPVHVKMVEDKLVVIDYYNPKMASEVGLQVGDVITHINDQAIDSIIKALLPFYPASNYPAQLRDITHDILRSTSDTLKISYTSGGTQLSKQLKLYEKSKLAHYYWYRRDVDGVSYKLLNGNIGYVTLKNIKNQDVRNIKRQFADAKGIIIDIRNYPAAFMPFALGPFFISKYTPFVKFSHTSNNNPGEFIFTDPIKILGAHKIFKNKLVVIVNELTQSQAEYTAMAFQAGDNTTVVGSTTAGADGNLSNIKLPGGLSTAISGIGVYYPDGTETQGIGIVPDIEVLPTIEGIKAGRDELLEMAIKVINQPHQAQ